MTPHLDDTLRSDAPPFNPPRESASRRTSRGGKLSGVKRGRLPASNDPPGYSLFKTWRERIIISQIVGLVFGVFQVSCQQVDGGLDVDFVAGFYCGMDIAGWN